MGRADTFVEASDELAPMVRRLLGRHWLVDTLATALRLANGAGPGAEFRHRRRRSGAGRRHAHRRPAAEHRRAALAPQRAAGPARADRGDGAGRRSTAQRDCATARRADRRSEAAVQRARRSARAALAQRTAKRGCKRRRSTTGSSRSTPGWPTSPPRAQRRRTQLDELAATRERSRARATQLQARHATACRAAIAAAVAEQQAELEVAARRTAADRHRTARRNWPAASSASTACSGRWNSCPRPRGARLAAGRNARPRRPSARPRRRDCSSRCSNSTTEAPSCSPRRTQLAAQLVELEQRQGGRASRADRAPSPPPTRCASNCSAASGGCKQSQLELQQLEQQRTCSPSGFARTTASNWRPRRRAADATPLPPSELADRRPRRRRSGNPRPARAAASRRAR